MEADIDIALKDILSKTATDLSDKISILETRDKYLREKRQKQTDLATAVAVVGTCDDMCPEYERYFRQHTNQLTIFELDELGSADETVMVKEYRRSSADQDEPLPHELRPIHVLNRTMSYLCANIMDDSRSVDMCGKWYEFLWDRTRSIRKDIVQQHLCDHISVSLIEKSARFYIHCAAVLCEEDLNNFDPKINEECLLNCIQSLKDYYRDLSLLEIYCPNEAEIRAYDILMHLNDGGMRLRELKHCRTQVQCSPHIVFAKSVFYSYQFNNYTKFFNLIKTGSYLFACVLHRYFISMRVRAFNVICKAYTSSSSSMFEFPNCLLIEQLGFDSQQHLTKFCDNIGLQCDENCVYLFRGLIEKSALKTQRSLLVENKRDCSVGTTVSGETLSQLFLKPVHSSFNANGKLINDFIGFDTKASINFDDNTVSHSDNTTVFSFRRAIETKANSQLQSRAHRSFVLDNKSDLIVAHNVNNDFVDSINSINSIIGSIIFDDMLTSLIIELLATILEEEKAVNLHLNQLTITLFPEIFLGVTNELIAEFCSEVIRKEIEIKIKKDQEMREKQVIVEAISSEINEDIICCEVDNQTKYLSEEVYQNSYQELIETHSQLAFHHLMYVAVESIVEDVAANVYNNARNEREMLVSEIQQKRYSRIEEKYFNKWRNWFLKRKRYQHYKKSFPAAPNWGTSSRQHVNNNHFLDSFSIIDSEIEKASKNIDIALKAINIFDKANSKRFDLISICENALCMSCEHTPQVDYKLAIYCEDQSICEWINTKFFDSKPLPWFPTVKTEIFNSINVNICVKGFFGYNLQKFSQKNSAIFGVHGMMIFVTRDNLKDTIINTFQLLRQKPIEPSIPLMIMFLDDVLKTDESLLKDKVDEIIREVVINQNTKQLTPDADLISDISITFVNRLAFDLYLKIVYSLIWLSKSRPNFAEIKLTKRFLRELIDSTIKQYFDVIKSLKMVELTIKKLPQFCKCFNATLDALSSILTSPQLQRISYPSKELNQELNQDWNSDQKLIYIKKLLNDLHLPETETDLSDLDDEYIILSFVDIITKQCIADSVHKNIEPTLFNAQINKALMTRNQSSNNCFVEILKACIYFILEFNFPVEKDFIVCCFKEDLLNSYTSLPSSWRLMYSNDTLVSKRSHSLSSPSLFTEQNIKRKRVNSEESLHVSNDSYSNIRAVFNDELTQSKAFTKRLSDALDQPISQELLRSILVAEHRINDSNNVVNEEVVIDDDEQQLSQCIDLNETTTEKLDRLKRLINQERDLNQQFIGTVNTFISILNLSENEQLEN